MFTRIITFISKQFLGSQINCFIALYGQQYFDIIFGIITYKFVGTSIKNEEAFDKIVGYLTDVAKLTTHELFTVRADCETEELDQNSLRE